MSKTFTEHEKKGIKEIIKQKNGYLPFNELKTVSKDVDKFFSERFIPCSSEGVIGFYLYDSNIPNCFEDLLNLFPFSFDEVSSLMDNGLIDSKFLHLVRSRLIELDSAKSAPEKAIRVHLLENVNSFLSALFDSYDCTYALQIDIKGGFLAVLAKNLKTKDRTTFKNIDKNILSKLFFITWLEALTCKE